MEELGTQMSKVIKRDRGWFVVSSRYAEASLGKVGGGWIWARAFATRALARTFKRTAFGRALG